MAFAFLTAPLFGVVADAADSLARTQLVLEATLTAAPSGTRLGGQIAMTADTLVSAGYQDGLLYVFTKGLGGWSSMTQTAVLSASDGAALYNVGIFGKTIVAGSTIGVYVFVEPQGGWVTATESAKLTGSDSPFSGFFSVSTNGNTVVAGAQYANCYTGAVYLFSEPSGGWKNMTETAQLTASDGVCGYGLGSSVSIYGNVVVAGALNATNAGGDGAVYVYVKPEGGWASSTQQAKLTDAASGYSQLGSFVAFHGDTILTSTYSGAAYIFVEPPGGWTDTSSATATLSDSRYYSALGYSVALDENFAFASAVAEPPTGDIFLKPATGWANATQTYQIPPTIRPDRSKWFVSVVNNTFAIADPDANAVYIYTK